MALDPEVPKETNEKKPGEIPVQRPVEVKLDTVFDNIAVAFSGGGFRAAAFALGTLSYLDSVKIDDPVTGKKISLIDSVRYISTASGGTLTGAYFALTRARGIAFKNCYDDLYACISAEVVLENALRILNDRKIWEERPHKRRNLINAFAMAYDDCLFKKATLGDLSNPKQISSLEEVCFNATEMYKGLTFRQQAKMKPDSANDEYFFYGDFYVKLGAAEANRLLLADIMAASSCFPLGFEPVVFPDDFTYQGLSINDLKAGLTIEAQTGSISQITFKGDKTIGLMDGGITDNQGLNSLILADGRRIDEETSFKRFDLIIVTDVASDYMKPYTVPSVSRRRGIFGQNFFWIMGELLLLTAGAVGALIYFINHFKATDHGLGWMLLFAFLSSLLVTIDVAAVWLNYFLFSTDDDRRDLLTKLDLDKTFSNNIVDKLGTFFKKTSVKVLTQMVKARLRSFVVINSDIFLKHIRRLIYDKFYESPVWRGRRKSNHIYDLSITNRQRIRDKLKDKSYASRLSVSDEIRHVAQRAYQMPTTLWFDKQHVTDNLRAAIVAAGQFTACYNLLEYIFVLEGTNSYDGLAKPYKDRLEKIKLQLEADLANFNRDPYILHNQLSPAHKVVKIDPVIADI